MSFPDDIEVSSSQLKRFNESVIDPECLLKIAATSFCLITFYPFQATLYFLVYYYFYLRSTVYMLSKMVWNYTQHYVLSNYCNLPCLFRFAIKFRCHLNTTMSPGFFYLFALFLRRDLITIAFEGSY